MNSNNPGYRSYDRLLGWSFGTGGAIFLILLVTFALLGGPHYRVWQQGLLGQAELARATQNRQIKIQEAQAHKDSATYLAEAEVLRAEGVAKANKIIGDSLQGNEAYLRYLWVQGLESNNPTVIYVPTEANLPLLEASRHLQPTSRPAPTR